MSPIQRCIIYTVFTWKLRINKHQTHKSQNKTFTNQKNGPVHAPLSMTNKSVTT
jgi:hypothetical protein